MIINIVTITYYITKWRYIYTNMNSIEEILAKLSPEEREATLKIMSEMANNNGRSKTLEDLYWEDYEEIPVSIDEFIENPEYAGNFTGGGSLIYPYWRERLREIFETPGRNYSEIALTGSIGIGKSTIAVLGLAYSLYKLMCLKDPQAYYRLAKGSTIVVAFFNNTLDLSNSVGYQTLQSLVKDSPWFMARGKLTGVKNVEYIPNKLIRFRVGSQAGHALGTNIFCIDGRSYIRTESGDARIDELVYKDIKVYSQADNNSIVLSDSTTVLHTADVDEIYEIELESGDVIRCTGDHILKLKTGEYKKVIDLTIDDELEDISHAEVLKLCETTIS